jgi:hypothetical protein
MLTVTAASATLLQGCQDMECTVIIVVNLVSSHKTIGFGHERVETVFPVRQIEWAIDCSFS